VDDQAGHFYRLFSKLFFLFRVYKSKESVGETGIMHFLLFYPEETEIAGNNLPDLMVSYPMQQ
jgi:hypothetical protein